MDISKATALLEGYVMDLNHEKVILTVSGKPVAVVLPNQGADFETISLSFNPEFLALMERSRIRYDREGGVSSEEMRRRLGLPPSKKTAGVKSPKTKTARNRTKANWTKPNGEGDGCQV